MNKENNHNTQENFNESNDRESKKKKKTTIKIISYFIIFLFVAFFIFSISASRSDQNKENWISRIPIIGSIKHLVESADKKLKGEEDDRINILLLGMGGKNHDGGYLTDTIMLASIEPSTKKVSLLSIPRDLAIPIEGYGWRKINHVNAYAEMESAESGGLAASQAISDVFNIPVHYYFRVDFQGFINIIDELGGITVNVERTLDDPMYPIMGRESAEPYESRFETLYVEKGTQEMDGSLALKFARSRHGKYGEGSDFARAKRQQLIIEATKEKLLSKWNFFKPIMVSNIIDEFRDHVSTNLKIWEIIKLWDIVKDVEKNNIINKVLDNSPSGLLTDMISQEGAYILSPRSGDFAEIEYLIKNIFSEAPLEKKEKVVVEKATLEIRNGTWINGLASETALDLEKYSFEVIRIGNSSRQNFQKSVIYDLTFGEKIDSLAILKEKTKANVSFEIPEWLQDDITKDLKNETNPEQPDFILILGQDADKNASGSINLED